MNDAATDTVLTDERMSDLDALVWHAERRPRDRTTIAALARFDAPIDPDRLRHRVDRVSRLVPRLRQRVECDPAGVAPRWTLDTRFRLDIHHRTVDLGGADEADALVTTRDLVAAPFDRTRPLWEIIHLAGLEGGVSAVLLKAHHCVADGVGGVAMMMELFDLDSTEPPERAGMPPAPRAPVERPSAASHLAAEAGATLDTVRTTLDALAVPRSLDEVVEAGRDLGSSLGSVARLLRSGSGTRVVPAQRSDAIDLRSFAVDVDRLRTAGRRVGGTVNDAFLTAVANGVRAHCGPDLETPLRLAVPVNQRHDGSNAGNRWMPGFLDVAPTTTMADIHAAMQDLRATAGRRILEPLAATLRRLPPPAGASLISTVGSAHDVAASNVPGSPLRLHLCGRPVRELVGFGPLSGCGINVTLLSHVDQACIGVTSDPAAVPDPDGLVAALEQAFAELDEGPT